MDDLITKNACTTAPTDPDNSGVNASGTVVISCASKSHGQLSAADHTATTFRLRRTTLWAVLFCEVPWYQASNALTPVAAVLRRMTTQMLQCGGRDMSQR